MIGSKLMKRESDNCLSDTEARLLLKSSPTSSIKERSLSTASSPACKRTSTPSTSSGQRSDKTSRRLKFWSNLKQKTSVHFRPKSSQEREEKRSEWNARGDIPTKVLNRDRFKRFLNLDFTKVDKGMDDNSDEVFLTPTTLEDFDSSSILLGEVKNQEKIVYILDVHLKNGTDLVVRDRCGTSDPYVKFKIGTKVVYKSQIIERNLNPIWDEKFTVKIEDLGIPIQVQIYDHDLGLLMDDFMGEAYIEPSTLCLDQHVELKLALTENKKNSRCIYMGHLMLQCCLSISNQDEIRRNNERFKCKTSSDIFKKKKRPLKAMANIVLVEGRDLKSMDDNGFSDPYVKLQLGFDKCKSKVKIKTLDPRWMESFDMEWMENESPWLDVNVFDHDVGGKDDVLGRTKLNLSSYEMNKTHHVRLPLEDGGGFLFILLTICSPSPSSSSSTTASIDPPGGVYCHDRFSLGNTFKNIQEIGELTVTIHQARDLLAADIGGKSDPYCVIELVNTRLQTQTDFKTLNPQWGRTFVIPVSDVHSILEVTVYDYDRSRKSEFLGKIAIPLLRITNNERKWYTLKDKKLQQPSKGSIELQMFLQFNHLRAVLRTLNPREEKYMIPEATFKLATMKSNIDRVFKLMEGVVRLTEFIDFCFKWENPFYSSIAFVTFIVIVWSVESYMIPIALIIILVKNYFALHSSGELYKDRMPQEFSDQDKKENEMNAKEEKKPQSLRERLQTIQDVCLQVQETMDAFASLAERVQNVFLWKVPWLSVLGIICLGLISCLLYMVPLRTLMMVWGVLRFTRRWRVGNNIPNNEMLDFLSRVPSNKELVEYREYLEVTGRWRTARQFAGSTVDGRTEK